MQKYIVKGNTVKVMQTNNVFSKTTTTCSTTSLFYILKLNDYTAVNDYIAAYVH